MLAAVPAGASPADGECPNATVVISGDTKGDRRVESPDVYVSAAGETRSDPSRRLATRQAVAKANQCSPDMRGPPEADGGTVESAEPILKGRRPMLLVSNWVSISDGISGVVEGGMPRRNEQRKHGTTRGPRRFGAQ